MMTLVNSAPEEGSSAAALPAYSRGYLVQDSAFVIKARIALPNGWIEAKHRVVSGKGALVAFDAAGATMYGRPTSPNYLYGKVSATVMLPPPCHKDHAVTFTHLRYGAAISYRTRHGSRIMTAVAGWEVA